MYRTVEKKIKHNIELTYIYICIIVYSTYVGTGWIQKFPLPFLETELLPNKYLESRTFSIHFFWITQNYTSGPKKRVKISKIITNYSFCSTQHNYTNTIKYLYSSDNNDLLFLHTFMISTLNWWKWCKCICDGKYLIRPCHKWVAWYWSSLKQFRRSAIIKFQFATSFVGTAFRDNYCMKILLYLLRGVLAINKLL